MSERAARVREAVERNRRRIWAICYRMTGERTDADDLAQEAAARAIERAEQLAEADATGWLLRLSARVCLDHLRHRRIVRRHTELVDPIAADDLVPGDPGDRGPEKAAILREDVRFAVVVALQKLSPRQRAALILHDVCDRPIEDVALALETNTNAAKALLHRARLAATAARRHVVVDTPTDSAVVERFARAIGAGAIDVLTELLADDAWGVVDGGGVVRASNRPTFGPRAISRQWANAKRRLGQDVTTEVRRLNGESAIVIRLAAMPEIITAIVHLETRGQRVVALRIHRDPRRIARLSQPLRDVHDSLVPG